LSTRLLIVLGWCVMALVTLPVAWKGFGRPYPLHRMAHLLWCWPGVWLVLFLAWLLDLNNENPPDFFRHHQFAQPPRPLPPGAVGHRQPPAVGARTRWWSSTTARRGRAGRAAPLLLPVRLEVRPLQRRGFRGEDGAEEVPQQPLARNNIAFRHAQGKLIFQQGNEVIPGGTSTTGSSPTPPRAKHWMVMSTTYDLPQQYLDLLDPYGRTCAGVRQGVARGRSSPPTTART
jgi:hypothetical protein